MIIVCLALVLHLGAPKLGCAHKGETIRQVDRIDKFNSHYGACLRALENVGLIAG